MKRRSKGSRGVAGWKRRATVVLAAASLMALSGGCIASGQTGAAVNATQNAGANAGTQESTKPSTNAPPDTSTAAGMVVGTPVVHANGVVYYPVKAADQGWKRQTVRVVKPTHPAPGEPARLLFVLPVDAGVDTPVSKWGDGLTALRRLGVPNRFNMTLIEPSFKYEPWYGDSATDPAHHMESFVVDDLVPFADRFVPPGQTPVRLLIGFSKSGNGALFLLLRHPEVFRAAAVWDSPAQIDQISWFPVPLTLNFGTQANYQSYWIPNLIQRDAAPFKQDNRLWISGDQAAWTPQMVQLNEELTAAGIVHTWVTGAVRQHSWTSGWLEGAVMGLEEDTGKAAGSQ